MYHWIQWLPLVKEHGSQPLPMINIRNGFGSAVASAIPLPGPHRNIQKLKNQECPTGGDKEISAYGIGSDPIPCALRSATECAQPILHFLNTIGQKLRIGSMHSKIHGPSNGGDRLGTLRSATERTGDRVCQTLSRMHWFPYHHLSGFPGFLIFVYFCAVLAEVWQRLLLIQISPQIITIITGGIWIQPEEILFNSHFNPASRSGEKSMMCGIPWAHPWCDNWK